MDNVKRVLIMTAVAAEKEAVLRGLNGDVRFDVRLAGVGPAAAAANTAMALASAEYDLVVSAGIGGGFPERAGVGSLVVSSEIVAADLGAETPEGFSSVDELGFGSSRVPVDETIAQKMTVALGVAGLPVCSGPILTVSTATGTAQSALMLTVRVPGAAAEGMEGFGVATAARLRGVPVLEIRAISNPVGPRNRAAWKIREALDALEAAGPTLLEVLR